MEERLLFEKEFGKYEAGEQNDILQPGQPWTKSSPVQRQLAQGSVYDALSQRPWLFPKSLPHCHGPAPAQGLTGAVREAAAVYPHNLSPTLHSCSRGGNLCLSLEVWHVISFPWSVFQTPLHPLLICEGAHDRG